MVQIIARKSHKSMLLKGKKNSWHKEVVVEMISKQIEFARRREAGDLISSQIVFFPYGIKKNIFLRLN